jgi:hypothetical protein
MLKMCPAYQLSCNYFHFGIPCIYAALRLAGWDGHQPYPQSFQNHEIRHTGTSESEILPIKITTHSKFEFINKPNILHLQD